MVSKRLRNLILHREAGEVAAKPTEGALTGRGGVSARLLHHCVVPLPRFAVED